MTTIMQPFQCDLQPQIPKHPITTHAQAHPKQLEATVTMRQKKSKPTAAATAAHRRYLSSPAAATLHEKTQKVSCSSFLPNKPRATFMQPLQCVSQHHVANLHVSTHMATPDDNNHAAIPMRSATTDSKTSHNYARTSTPKATWSHRYNAAKKSKPTAAVTTAHRRYLSSLAAATLHGKTQGLVPQLPPQHKPRATFMQPLQCVSKHHVAKLHVSTHMATPDDNNHAAIPMRSATGDSKTPHNYARASTPKAAWSHRYNATKKRQTDRSRNRRTQEVSFIAGCSHFTRKNTRFRSPASSPTQAPCITMRFSASCRKPARIYAHGNARLRHTKVSHQSPTPKSHIKVSHQPSKSHTSLHWVYSHVM